MEVTHLGIGNRRCTGLLAVLPRIGFGSLGGSFRGSLRGSLRRGFRGSLRRGFRGSFCLCGFGFRSFRRLRRLRRLGGFRLLGGIQELIVGGPIPQGVEQAAANGGITADPADQRRFGGAAIIGLLLRDPVGIPQDEAQIGILGRGVIGSGNLHGLHAVDVCQLPLGISQLELFLFHIQPLFFHLQVRQGGIKGHEKIALFHPIPFLDQNFGHGLGVGDEHGLNFIRGHGAAAFLGVAPVFRHAHKGEGVDIHRIRPGVSHLVPDAAANGHRCHTGGDTEDHLLPGFPKGLDINHSPHPPSRYRRDPAARRRGCGRSYLRRRQWQARG